MVSGLYVAREVAGCTERLGASCFCARMSGTSHVHLEMTRELFVLGEDARALWRGTLQFLDQVDAAMASEVARGREALRAGLDLALVGLFACVSLEVFVESKLAVEPAVAGWLGTLE